MIHRIELIVAAFVTVTVLAVLPCEAQAPDEAWRTLQTEHYRVHFPEAYEEWARYAAERLESVREIVGREVGYVPEGTVDVVVMDPIARANGSAWPFLDDPRMVLWTSPPGPESVIGNYADWVELLTIHEQAHLAHLLRPSRNLFQRVMGEWLGLGPITLRAPRWVSEGYATVIEGDLTGAGRPQSDIRAAILRKWAQQGRLPSYSQMSSDSRSYLGMSMAYLAGSAYLEWLREREGPESFMKVWARLSARKARSFDEAFSGVYGDSPSVLYARFRAELIHDALELEERLEPVREGELWQDLSWQTGEPAVSPDGTMVATVLRGREAPARLVVWETSEDEEALEKWEEEIRELLEKDPEDVAPVRRKPLRRKPKHELVSRDGADIVTPRWLPDGSILFVRYEPDADGFLHPDLFRWRPEEGDVERLTWGADLREPTPISEYEVVAVRRRHGKSGLVRYDLVSGQEQLLTEPALDTVPGWPRADRDGGRIAFTRHFEGRWRLTILDLESGSMRDLDLPGGVTTVAWPEWSPDGRHVYATVGKGGLLDIWRFDVRGQTSPEPLTRSFGAAMAPSIGGDGHRLFFLGLDADGLDLRVLDPLPAEGLGPIDPALASLVPLGRPAVREAEPLTVAGIGQSTPYGIGRLETRWLFGGGRTPSEETWEAGLRLGDLVGRFDSIIVGAISSGGPQGGSARAVWRGWPVEVEGHLFGFERDGTESPVSIPGASSSSEDRWGGEVILGWDRRWRNARLDLEGGIIIDRIELPGEERFEADREIGFVSLRAGQRRLFHPWVVGGSADLGVFAGDHGGESGRGWTGEVGIVAGLEDHSVAAWYRRGEVDQDIAGVTSFVTGGAPTSLTPEFDHLLRIWSPGLVMGTVAGAEYEGWRAEIDTELLPVVPFYEAHRAGDSLAGDWINLVGLRLDLALDPLPLLKIPGTTVSLGGAHILDGPREDRTEWWITTRWTLD